MVVNQKPTGRASSMPGGLAFGAVVSVAVTVIAAVALAWMMDKEILSQDQIGYGVMVLLVTASFAGAMASFGKIKRLRMMVCVASGVIYFGLLLSLTALIFGGQFNGVGVTFLLITAGSLSAALMGLRVGKGRKIKKFKMPNR